MNLLKESDMQRFALVVSALALCGWGLLWASAEVDSPTDGAIVFDKPMPEATPLTYQMQSFGVSGQQRGIAVVDTRTGQVWVSEGPLRGGWKDWGSPASQRPPE